MTPNLMQLVERGQIAIYGPCPLCRPLHRQGKLASPGILFDPLVLNPLSHCGNTHVCEACGRTEDMCVALTKSVDFGPLRIAVDADVEEARRRPEGAMVGTICWPTGWRDEWTELIREALRKHGIRLGGD